jgi:hypothetical protein
VGLFALLAKKHSVFVLMKQRTTLGLKIWNNLEELQDT